MKTKMKLCAWFITIFSIIACASYDGLVSPSRPTFRLNDGEIEELLATIVKIEDTKLRFHIFYDEIFNDSTALLRIWQNQLFANETLGVCRVSQLEGVFVFEYDSVTCHMDLPDSLTSDRKDAPFVLHSPYWTILATRRNNAVIFYDVRMFLELDPSLKLPSELLEN